MTLRVLDLFSGIGGFSLGLERAGMKTVSFCEIDPFCRRVLAKHWPGVPCYDDVRTLTAERLRADGIAADVICGGFPCQDISVAGKGAGIDGARSGLWGEYARIISDVRPRFVIVENVAALLGRGLARVLGDLAALGFDAEWHCIPASSIGAPHRRDRLWIVAYSAWDVQSEQAQSGADRKRIGECGESLTASDTESLGWGARWKRGSSGLDSWISDTESALADAFGRDAGGYYFRWPSGARWWEREPLEALCDARQGGRQEDGLPISESLLGRVAHGVSDHVDRLRSLGNAVVPQIPELIGRAIMAQSREAPSS